MKPRRQRLLWPMVIGTAVTVFLLTSSAAAQDPEPVDTDGDGQLDDFDGDGRPDDADGDCVPDDKDGPDGVPDGIPDAATEITDCSPGEGGSFTAQLSLAQINVVLGEVFAVIPDVTEPSEVPDTFPNIPRLIENGVDTGPDWTVLDDLIGEPGVRDLLQLPDDRINQALLEEEDVNNIQFLDPLNPDDIILVATDDARAYTLSQINAARGDQGLIGGSGATLRGPCLGIAWSYDSDGQPLDVAWDWDEDGPTIGFRDGPIPEGELAVEEIFNSDNPFRVDVDGAVIYTGVAGGIAAGTGPLDHDWFIELNFLGFAGTNIDAGGDPNGAGENRNLGAVNLNEDLPTAAKISGLVAVNGQMSAPESGTGVRGDNGDVIGDGNPFFCIASGFVDFQGGIPLTAPGVALLFLSTVGMLFNARPARTFGGI
jgi:hypothetical protein